MKHVTTSIDIDDALNDEGCKVKSLLRDLWRSTKSFFCPHHRYLFKVIPTYYVPHGHLMEETLTAIALDFIKKSKITDYESSDIYYRVYAWFNIKKPELEDEIENLLRKWKTSSVTLQEEINKQIAQLNAELHNETTSILNFIILNRDKFYL